MHKRRRVTYSHAHLSTQKRKLEGSNYGEKNNRKTRKLHRLRTMRSLLHSAAFKIERHCQSLQRERPKPISRVTVERNKPVSFAIQCRHCEDAPCVTACLSGAMTKDEKTGLVTHNKDKCMGCWTCIMVCPYGAVKMDKEGHVVAKCDLCQGFDEPACVANCPNEALVFKEVKQ